jgi:hypothetical protein
MRLRDTKQIISNRILSFQTACKCYAVTWCGQKGQIDKTNARGTSRDRGDRFFMQGRKL